MKTFQKTAFTKLLSLMLAVLCLCTVLCVPASAWMPSNFDEYSVVYENGVITATLNHIAAGDFTLYVLPGDGYGVLSVASVVAQSIATQNYPSSEFASAQTVSVSASLQAGAYTLVAIKDSYSDDVDLATAGADSRYAAVSFEVKNDSSCFLHWILLGLLLLFAAFVIVTLFVWKKQKADICSLSTSALVAVASLILGILALPCTLCLVLMIVNVAASGGFAAWLWYEGKKAN